VAILKLRWSNRILLLLQPLEAPTPMLSPKTKMKPLIRIVIMRINWMTQRLRSMTLLNKTLATINELEIELGGLLGLLLDMHTQT